MAAPGQRRHDRQGAAIGKTLRTVAILAVAVAVAVYAPQLSAALVASGVSTTAAAAITAVASLAVTAAASYAVSLTAPKPSAATAGPSIFRQAISNSFLIYGKRRVGGLLSFYHPVGKDFRYYVVAVAGHRCKGVTRWYLGDDEVTVDGSGMVLSGTYANNAWLWFARGTEDQAANATFVAETQGKWTANHRARGAALIYAKFKMVEAVVQAGMPNITAEVEGKDDIVDPRTGVAGYTRNAALIFYDWLRLAREEGGFGAYDDEIDDDWVSAQANVCDETCALPDGGTEARYEMDCYITTGAAPSEVRDTLVTCCAGSFTYSGGKMLMRPGYYVPPSATLIESDLAGAINVPALLAGDQTATEMTGTYVDPANLYQPRDVPTRSGDSDDVRQSSIDLPHITSGTRAQRILEIALRKSQAERRVTWPMNIVGIGIATMDTVQLATPRYGLSNYSFQVASWGLSQDFSVVLQLEETSPEIFEFTPDMYRAIGETGQLVKADPISELPSRAVYRIISQSVAYPVTSDADSISVTAFTAVIDDGRTIALPAGSVEGLESGMEYVLLWSPSDQAYSAAVSPAIEALASPAFVLIRYVTTQNVDGTYPGTPTAPGGDGGGGGGGRFNENEQIP
jgi:hypothetical protein